MEMRYYKLKTSNVSIIGDFPYFDETDEVEICNLGFGSYRGIEVKKCNQNDVYNEVYKTKKEALEKAKRAYADNAPYADGTIPFEIVFYLRGIGWQVFSSNTINNDILMRKKLGVTCVE